MYALKCWRSRRLGVAVLLSAAASAVLLFAAGASGATTTLYDQNDNFSSEAFGAAASWGNAMADDFVVPASTSWHVTSVFASGWDAGNLSSVTVNIYADSSGAPGTSPIYTTTVASPSFTDAADPYWSAQPDHWPGGDLTVPVDVTLPAGHYWLSVWPDSSWWWNIRDLVSSTPAMLIDPIGLTGTGCTSWADLAGCYGRATGSLDLMFTLSGEIVQATPSASAQIADLKATISGMNLKKATTAELNEPLTEALAALRQHEKADAIGAMKDFIQCVKDQPRRALTQSQAATLISAAQAIIATLRSS